MVPLNIVLISSGQPSLNPRLVKEADALAGNGYSVTVLYAYWNEWGTQMDKKLLSEKRWRAVRAGGDPVDRPFTYLFSKVIFRLAIFVTSRLKLFLFADWAISRATYFLSAAAKRHPADLYICHNLGALPAGIRAANLYQKPCGFDAEDFHRFEASEDEKNFDVQLKSHIENKYLPLTNYITASSEQIAKAYCILFPKKTPFPILNVFPVSTVTNSAIRISEGRLKLFWFSQTIGEGRGLEFVIDALSAGTEYRYELHLLGHLPDGTFRDYLFNTGLANNNLLFIYPPVSPADIPVFSARFDIGLAVETGQIYNRDICLTNKIFTYLQAGLGILASNTTAQQFFMDQYPAIGKTYQKDNLSSLVSLLTYFDENRQAVKSARMASLELGHTSLNWEAEGQKFLKIVNETAQR